MAVPRGTNQVGLVGSWFYTTSLRVLRNSDPQISVREVYPTGLCVEKYLRWHEVLSDGSAENTFSLGQ